MRCLRRVTMLQTSKDTFPSCVTLFAHVQFYSHQILSGTLWSVVAMVADSRVPERRVWAKIKSDKIPTTEAKDTATDLIFGRWRSQTLYAGVELGVFEVVGESPKHTVEIADQLAIDRELGYRLLRALGSPGLNSLAAYLGAGTDGHHRPGFEHRTNPPLRREMAEFRGRRIALSEKYRQR